MVFVTGLEGGVSQNSEPRCHNSILPYLSHSSVLSSVNRPRRAEREKKRGRERPPQKWGGHVTLDSGAESHASIRPHAGSLSSSFIPAGRLGTAPPEGR